MNTVIERGKKQKLSLRDADHIAARDDIGACATCTDLALDGERFCRACKDYWEEDAPAFANFDDWGF
ncbi:hypothetical protein [Pseudohoeflea coraliihabitans]|uniref:NinF family protein n=1 Tax=Pseudohoeflea coraliihabitans TaxID=2860393 RepID=A0ABS6WLS1_9HYPH|nr:hypothetical protein [Pseudohoeflea sp. DP4N28-3]MBW3096850.1 hypothetical protein [Pseudohoeflea sp. DP4N28-3]